MQRGAVLVQTRAGGLEPVRPEPRRQARAAAGARAPQPARTADGRQRRMLEQQPIGDTGYQPGDRPQLRRAQPQDKRQMQKELQEGQRSELGAAGGIARVRGGQQLAMVAPGGRYPAEAGCPPQGQCPEAPGRLTLTLTSPPNLHGGHFAPGSPKHFNSRGGEAPEIFRQGAVSPQALQRVGAAMGQLVTPVRVSSGAATISPRNLNGPSPRRPTSTAAQGFVEDNPSPRFSAEAEKTPRSAAGRQDRPWKTTTRHPSEVPIGNPSRRTLAQGDVAGASEHRRGISKDQVDERLLRNVNPKVLETKGGKTPNRGKFQTTTGRMASEQHRNPPLADDRRGEAIYQLEKFGRGGAVGPPHRDPQSFSQEMYGPKAAQLQGRNISGMQSQQIPAVAPSLKVPVSSPMKKNLTRASTDASRMASQKKTLPPATKKTTTDFPTNPPSPLLASPAITPVNSPRSSLMATSNVPGRITNATKTSPRSSPPITPKSPSSTNSPTRTYVITPKPSPTALPVPIKRNTGRTTKAAVTGNTSTKLPVDASASKTGKEGKGRYPNPKSRLSAGGDLLNTKERPKIGVYKVSTEEPAYALAGKLAAAPTAQYQQSKEAGETKELSDVNKEEQFTRTSPRVRKLTRTSNSYLLPVANTFTPRSADSAQLQDEDHGKSANTLAKQPEVPLRKPDVGEGNKKQLAPLKNRKGTASGAINNEGPREAVPAPARGRAVAARHRRARDSPRGVDVAATLPDTSGNFTSAVHQWLRQSHYKVISPQQYRQHETIEEEIVKQPVKKPVAFPEARQLQAATPEPQKLAAPERGAHRGRAKAARREDIPRSISPLSVRCLPKTGSARPLRTAPLSLLMKQKEVTTTSKAPAAVPAARAGKKASRAVASPEGGKRKVSTRRAKALAARRRKEKEREAKPAPVVCPRMRPRRGPAGDSGDLDSSSSEDSSYLSASDEGMHEQSAMC